MTEYTSLEVEEELEKRIVQSTEEGDKVIRITDDYHIPTKYSIIEYD